MPYNRHRIDNGASIWLTWQAAEGDQPGRWLLDHEPRELDTALGISLDFPHGASNEFCECTTSTYLCEAELTAARRTPVPTLRDLYELIGELIGEENDG